MEEPFGMKNWRMMLKHYYLKDLVKMGSMAS